MTSETSFRVYDSEIDTSGFDPKDHEYWCARAVEGLWDVNVVGADDTSPYPPSADKVLVHRPTQDGYCDITVLDENGAVLRKNNRAMHRIVGALEGKPGYDMVVRE